MSGNPLRKALHYAWLPGILLLVLTAAYLCYRADAPNGQQAEVPSWLPLPKEAKIVRSEQDWFGFEHRVLFRLPETRAPEVWLKAIAEEYRIGNSRQSQYRYSYRHGLRRVEYFPYRHLYEIYHYDD